MKTIATGLDHSQQTMTVKDLREALSNYPDDLPVMATWESVYAPIESKNFTVELVRKYVTEEAFECLVIDVHDY